MQPMFLREARVLWPEDVSCYPYMLPAVRAFDGLSLDHPVIFLVGENGSGKSTILEALAIAAGLNPEGGSFNARFHTYESHASVALRLVRGVRRPRDGYFLRAESFYNVATYIEALDAEGGFGPPVKDSYGGSLHERSHGEAFLALLQNRLGGNGLYLFDEPEAALSPARLLTMLALLHGLVERGSQCIIATHSPMLMAYPGAVIYELSETGIAAVDYRQTQHYQLTRRFLEAPERYFRHLWGEEGGENT